MLQEYQSGLLKQIIQIDAAAVRMLYEKIAYLTLNKRLIFEQVLRFL